MIGIDLVKVERFNNKSLKFCQRFLSPNELKILETITNANSRARFLASAWGIKEAIFKCDNHYYNFRHINLNIINGRWVHDKFYLSASHEKGYLVAVALKKKEE